MNRADMVNIAAQAIRTKDGQHDMGAGALAEVVLDAILPQVTTVAELESLPVGSVVIDVRGETWKDRTNIDGLWYGTDLDEITVSRLSAYSPLTVVWQPEVTK